MNHDGAPQSASRVGPGEPVEAVRDGELAVSVDRRLDVVPLAIRAFLEVGNQVLRGVVVPVQQTQVQLPGAFDSRYVRDAIVVRRHFWHTGRGPTKPFSGPVIHNHDLWLDGIKMCRRSCAVEPAVAARLL